MLYSIRIPLFVVVMMIICNPHLPAQNLVPNPSFEDYTTCPFQINPGLPIECIPWFTPTAGSTDYFNACDNPGPCGTPQNAFGFQVPRTGVAYAMIGTWSINHPAREYLTVELTTPLQAGLAYQVTWYISKLDQGCGTTGMSAYLSTIAPSSSNDGPLPINPNFSAPYGIMEDETNWVPVTGCYAAFGGERFLTIGNFQPESEIQVSMDCQPFPFYGGYYIEDVSVIEVGDPSEFDLELGDPVYACEVYEIDPGISNADYYRWEDGSFDPTLTVTESGTYAVTIAIGCSFGIDSIEVNIFHDTIVDLGVDEINLCIGEEYTFNLDPDLGTYTWQDGSNDPDYVITEPGLYSVTLNDVCHETTDEVNVVGFSPVDPDFLGPDVELCQNEEIVFDFDPSLGAFLWQDGSTNSQYTVASEGFYALTITNACGVFTDQIDIDFIPYLDIDFGADTLALCPGDQLIFDFAADGFYLWQDGSDFPSYTVMAPGTYAVTVTNMCEITTGTIEVIEPSPPFVELGPDMTLCAAQLPVTLDLSLLTDEYILWQDGAHDDLYVVSQPGTYHVEVSNDCYTVFDTIQINVQQPDIDVSLPGDQVLCPGETFVLHNTGDQGTYQWQDNSTGDTLLVTTPGWYSLTVTTICGTGVDSVFIQYLLPLALPALGPDFSICPGSTAVLSTGIDGATYVWQDLSTADTLLISSAGTYSVSVSDGCTTLADTIEITVNDTPPFVDLPASVDLCSGESLVLDPQINSVAYIWNDLSTADTLLITSPGIYAVTVSNACGADQDTVMVIDAGQAPTIELGDNVALCPGQTQIIEPLSSAVANWLWQNGSTSSTYEVQTNEIISVIVTNTCGIAYDTITATILPPTPIPDLGMNVMLCPGQDTLLEVTVPFETILWSDGSSQPTLLANDAGIYQVTITDACGTNTDEVEVTTSPAAPNVYLGTDQSLCPGEVIILDPHLQNVTYEWQDGSTTPTYTTTDPGTFILTASNVCGTDMDTIVITISTEGPDVNLGDDIIACEGETVILMSDISGVAYVWQDGSTNSSYAVNTTGSYYVQVSNNCGMDADTIEVNISGLIPDTELGPDTAICSGAMLILMASGDPANILEWQDGSMNDSFVVQSAGTYVLTESNHCGVHEDSIQVTTLPLPVEFDLGPDTLLCLGEVLTLHAPVTTDQIEWQDGSSSSNYLVDQSSVYSLTISNECGISSDEIVVDFSDQTPVINLDDEILLCPGDVVQLDVTQPFPAHYTWSHGPITPQVTLDATGLYTIVIETGCGSADKTIILSSADCPNEEDFFIPNIFSPNGDGVNDLFAVVGKPEVDVITIGISIFDRWGNLVFASSQYPVEWNGQTHDRELNPGVFTYKLDVEYLIGTQEHQLAKSGDLVLIK